MFWIVAHKKKCLSGLAGARSIWVMGRGFVASSGVKKRKVEQTTVERYNIPVSARSLPSTQTIHLNEKLIEHPICGFAAHIRKM